MPVTHAPSSRYKCCCGCCRATTGALIVGLLDVLVAAIALWQGFTGKIIVFTASHSEYEQPMRQTCLVGAGVFGAIGLLAVFAVICRLPCLLIFHMVVDIAVLLAFGLLAALVVIITFVTVAEEQQTINGNETTRIIIFLCVLCAFALLQIWYFLVMLSAYRFLSEEPNIHGGHSTAGAGVTNNGSGTHGQQQAYYFTAPEGTAVDGKGGLGVPVGGVSAPAGYTPMLSTPNYYKQHPATSPPMYG